MELTNGHFSFYMRRDRATWGLFSRKNIKCEDIPSDMGRLSDATMLRETLLFLFFCAVRTERGNFIKIVNPLLSSAD